jgi:hypothetical protein
VSGRRRRESTRNLFPLDERHPRVPERPRMRRLFNALNPVTLAALAQLGANLQRLLAMAHPAAAVVEVERGTALARPASPASLAQPSMPRRPGPRSASTHETPFTNSSASTPDSARDQLRPCRSRPAVDAAPRSVARVRHARARAPALGTDPIGTHDRLRSSGVASSDLGRHRKSARARACSLCWARGPGVRTMILVSASLCAVAAEAWVVGR